MDIDEILEVLLKEQDNIEVAVVQLPALDSIIEEYKALTMDNHTRTGYTKMADDEYIEKELINNRKHILDDFIHLRDQITEAQSIITILINKIGNKDFDIRRISKIEQNLYRLTNKAPDSRALFNNGLKCDADFNKFIKRAPISRVIDTLANILAKTAETFKSQGPLVTDLLEYITTEHGLKMDLPAIEQALNDEGLNVGRNTRAYPAIDVYGPHFFIYVYEYGVVPAVKAKAIIKKVLTDFGIDKEYDLSTIHQLTKHSTVHPGYSLEMKK